MIPEYAATLILKLWDNHHQAHYSPESHDSSFSDLKRYIHRMCASTIILIAGFASVVATATFLNEQIRISEQATKAALLQSRLFGKWSQNLILVPGRKLLKYGLVKKVSILNFYGVRFLKSRSRFVNFIPSKQESLTFYIFRNLSFWFVITLH